MFLLEQVGFFKEIFLVEPLKNQFGSGRPGKIAGTLFAVYPLFPTTAFIMEKPNSWASLILAFAHHLLRRL